MKKTLHTLYIGFPKTKTALCLLALVVYCLLLAVCGAGIFEFALLALTVLFLVVIPGAFLAHTLGPTRIPKGFFVPASLLCGFLFLTLCYLAAMLLGLPWLLPVIAPLVAIISAFFFWRRPVLRAKAKQVLSKRPQPHQWMLLLLFCALLLLYAFGRMVKNAHPLAVGDILIDQDILQYAGDAAALKLSFPPPDIRFLGVPLYYHYLTALFAAALSLATGVSCYNIIGFYLQPFLLAALVLCLYALGMIVYKGNRFKTLLFTYSLFLFGCASLWKILPNGLSVFWNSSITHHITNINSQTTGAIFLCLFTGLFVAASRQKYKVPFAWHALAVASFAFLSLAKGPPATIMVIAVALVLLWGLFRRQTSWQGLLLGAALAGVFLISYFALFHASQSTEGVKAIVFSFTGTLEKGYFKNILARLLAQAPALPFIAIPALWLLQSFLMLPAQFPLYLRGLAADIRRISSLSPERLLYNAVAAGGLLAYFLFDHNAMSQVYFFIVAGFFINILAVDATGYIAALCPGAMPPHKSATPKKRAFAQKAALAFVAFFATVGVATAGFLYVNMLGGGARQLGRNLGLLEKYPYDLVVTPDDEAAMLWLRDNTPKDTVFATNRIHSGRRYEGVSNLYSAFSERQGFCDGFQYTYYNAGLSNDDVGRRLQANEAIFGGAPQDEVLALCKQYGITYLVFCTQMESVDASDEHLRGLPLVWDAESIRVYRVP